MLQIEQLGKALCKILSVFLSLKSASKVEQEIKTSAFFMSVKAFFEILELKFTSVNEHFKISKVTKKLALVKNTIYFYQKQLNYLKLQTKFRKQ